MKIVFMGTPEFAVPSLRRLCEDGYDVVCVVTQPDRQKGRGRSFSKSPVSAEAERLGIENILKPEKIKNEGDTIEKLRSLGAEMFVVCAYGQILSQEILDIPKYGCVNIHASILPKYRGAAPIERSLMDGCDITGISIMKMEKGLDTGPVYACETTEIKSDDTGESLRNRLSTMGADLMARSVAGIADGTLVPVPQEDEKASYAHMLDRSDAVIRWDRTADAIERQVRGLLPKPGAGTTLSGRVLKIKGAMVCDRSKEETGNLETGTVLKADKGVLEVLCGEGTVLSVTRVQMEGRKEMDVADFLRGFRVETGTVLQ
ncbi:MAG: methionyl-tRNA formyltransferase [Lachnospiraceae bacterium]|nr:methionyl-tRNA formyltransferase [Lachnospiraceae bacterium]